MGYWHDIDLYVYESWEDFCVKQPDANPWLVTKHGAHCYHEVSYEDGDWLMFGRESTGIDRAILQEHPERCLRIPMVEREGLSPATTPGPYADPADPDAVSLNLSNAANIVMFEALRQIGFPGMFCHELGE